MDYVTIRRVVEEEVVKSLSSATATPRIKRPVVSESMVAQAKRRGSKVLEIPPGAIITPAARDRAETLGIKITQTLSADLNSRDAAMLAEAVMSSVVAYLSRTESLVPKINPVSANDRKLITASDIDKIMLGEKVIRLSKKDRITPLARDNAERSGVRIIEE